MAVGTKNGMVQIWDAQAQRCIRKMSGHTARGRFAFHSMHLIAAMLTLVWSSQLVLWPGTTTF